MSSKRKKNETYHSEISSLSLRRRRSGSGNALSSTYKVGLEGAMWPSSISWLRVREERYLRERSSLKWWASSRAGGPGM